MKETYNKLIILLFTNIKSEMIREHSQPSKHPMYVGFKNRITLIKDFLSDYKDYVPPKNIDPIGVKIKKLDEYLKAFIMNYPRYESAIPPNEITDFCNAIEELKPLFIAA